MCRSGAVLGPGLVLGPGRLIVGRGRLHGGRGRAPRMHAVIVVGAPRLVPAIRSRRSRQMLFGGFQLKVKVTRCGVSQTWAYSISLAATGGLISSVRL